MTEVGIPSSLKFMSTDSTDGASTAASSEGADSSLADGPPSPGIGSNVGSGVVTISGGVTGGVVGAAGAGVLLPSFCPWSFWFWGERVGVAGAGVAVGIGVIIGASVGVGDSIGI
jgi:hypothetical protein